MSCPIVVACDAAYAMQLATTLRSIVESNQSSWPLEVYVLSDGLIEGTRTMVINSLPGGSASILWIPVELGLFQEFATLSYISKMTYVRLLIPRVLPSTVSRVLYLDADLLVLDDLTPIWETNLEEDVVGAVLDRWHLQIKLGELGLEGLPNVQDYFNAGVLLIDLNRWRNERISEKALEYLVQYPRSPFSDQDALNVACDGRWKQLDPRWNFQNHCGNRIVDVRQVQRPGIVHFVGKEKPWIASMLNANANLYDAFRSRTCFARTGTDKLSDIFQVGWFTLKGVLRQYGTARRLWKLIRPSMLN